MKKATLLAVLLVLMTACATHERHDAERVLRAQGFSYIILDGYAFFGCAQEDNVSTKFSACRETGECISGVLCSRWPFKGITVRYD